jgi:hypothetical protein
VSKGWKIALIVLGCLFLGTLSMCGACYFWFKSNAEQWAEQGKRVKEEAEEFAATHNDSDCVDDALARADGCESKSPVEAGVCGAMVNVFLESCMNAAKQTDAACEGVPKELKIMEIAQWAVSTCSGRKKEGSQSCTRIMQTVQRVCMTRLTHAPQ